MEDLQEFAPHVDRLLALLAGEPLDAVTAKLLSERPARNPLP